jgi:hypothetical protein
LAFTKLTKENGGYKVTSEVITSTEEVFDFPTLDEAVAKIKELEQAEQPQA